MKGWFLCHVYYDSHPKPDCAGEHPSCPVISFIINPLSPVYSPLRSGVKKCNRESILLFNTALSAAHFSPGGLTRRALPPHTESLVWRSVVDAFDGSGEHRRGLYRKRRETARYRPVSSPVLTRSPGRKLLCRSWRARPVSVQAGAATCVLCSPSAWGPVGDVGEGSSLQGQKARHVFLAAVHALCDLGHVIPLPWDSVYTYAPCV